MKLELRDKKLREVRKSGFVPGVMYGKSIESTSVQAEDKELKDALKMYGKNMTFKVRVDGKYHQVYIKNVQSNMIKPSEIIHFDLHRVTAKETISAHIPVELIGVEAFHNQKLYPDLVINEVAAEYIPGQGVQSFKVDVSKLVLGDVIKLKDIKLSAGIILKDDLETVVVTIKEIHVPVDDDTDTTEQIEIETEETPKD